ncbi:hypothetical protein M5689_012707 [Euphorbia peplus]|nr:hypothetical protein M5689_012707 [Euphorbia peplus]
MVTKLDFSPVSFSSIFKIARALSFPRSIGRVRELEKINISGFSKLEGVHETIGNLTNYNLAFLTLQNCENLQNPLRSIGDLKSLKELTLSGYSKLRYCLNPSGSFLTSFP